MSFKLLFAALEETMYNDNGSDGNNNDNQHNNDNTKNKSLTSYFSFIIWHCIGRHCAISALK